MVDQSAWDQRRETVEGGASCLDQVQLVCCQSTPEQVYAAIADAHHALEGKSITGPPLSLVNLYQSMADKDQNARSLFQQVVKVPEDQRKIFLIRMLGRHSSWRDVKTPGGHPIDELLTGIENEFEQLESKHPGFQFRVTETVLHGIRNANMIVADLIKSLLMAVARIIPLQITRCD